MRLLKKSAVASEASQQKKQLIDEGIAIARKVDALRQALAGLEEQQSRFVGGMEEELRRRTKALFDEIAGRESEIRALEERRKDLTAPLDAEWQKVRSASSEVQSSKMLIEKGLKVLAEKEKMSEEKHRNSKAVLARVNVRERELLKIYEKAEEAADSAEIMKAIAAKEKEESGRDIAERHQAILSREASVAVREREQDILAAMIEEKEREIISEKARLKDRSDTLERAFRRLQK